MISRAHRRLSTALLVAALVLTSASIAAVHATPSIAPSITFGTEAVDLSNENRTSSINDVHAIAASGSNVYVTWVAGAVFFKASHDNGSSWGSVVKLTVSTGKVSLQKLAADGLNVYVVYLETIL